MQPGLRSIGVQDRVPCYEAAQPNVVGGQFPNQSPRTGVRELVSVPHSWWVWDNGKRLTLLMAGCPGHF